jgi:hypothetical protein
MRFARRAFCLAILLLGFSGAAISLRIDGSKSALSLDDASTLGHLPRQVSALPEPRVANGDWADRLSADDFWQQLRAPQSRSDAPRRELGSARSQAPRRSSASHRSDEARSRSGHARNRDGGTYRTVCVRLCDGYFWPVSFAASRTTLDYDRRKCEQSCGSPAKLYAARDVEAPLEDMQDENGRYYGELKTAFVYRSAYLESCKCRAHPWEAESQARHAGYAQETRPRTRNR